MSKEISYIYLITGYILQKYIKTNVDCSRSFIAKCLFLNPNLLPDIKDLLLVGEKKKKEKVILVWIFVEIKIIE